jgi:DNA repair exonuclease SbcCD ATPase subunit
MNIEFEYIEIQNFKSIGPLQIFNFKELNNMNYIYGTNLDAPQSRNGSGKSTYAVDSIIFALFGRTLKNTNNKYIPNRYCDSKLKSYVKLYFTVDGQRYSSECFCKPKIGTVGMELKRWDKEANDWEDITQSSVIKTRQYIQDSILGCSFDLFKTAIVVSASDCMNFYENMGKQAKRNFVENIFNLNCFGVMFADIKSDLNSIKKELTYTNNEIIKSSERLNQLKEKFEAYDQQLTENILQLKNEMISKYNLLQENNTQLKELNVALENFAGVEEDYKKLRADIKTVNAAEKKLEKEILDISYKIKTINAVLKEVETLKSGLCEVCTELFNSRYGYNEKEEEIKSLQTQLETKNTQLTKLQDVIKTYETREDELVKNLDEFNNTKHQIDKLEFTIKSITTEIKKLKTEYDSLITGEANPFKELIEKTQNELETLKIQMVSYVRDIKHLELLRDACSETGVKRFIIKDIVKLLNSLIQKYLNEIGAEYLVYFDESFDFKFITVNGECEFSNFSTGERQRIQIATILAFRDLILNGKINSNIFVIDEFLDSGIDAIAIKNILSILSKKSFEANQNIFIISHRQETTESVVFNHIIEVIKENGISTLKIN